MEQSTPSHPSIEVNIYQKSKLMLFARIITVILALNGFVHIFKELQASQTQHESCAYSHPGQAKLIK